MASIEALRKIVRKVQGCFSQIFIVMGKLVEVISSWSYVSFFVYLWLHMLQDWQAVKYRCWILTMFSVKILK